MQKRALFFRRSCLAALSLLLLLIPITALAAPEGAGGEKKAADEERERYPVEVVSAPEGDPEEYDPCYDYHAVVPEREAVEDDWFDNAAFVGDSRTQGLMIYSELKNTGAANLSYQGLNVTTAYTQEVTAPGMGRLTPMQAVSRGGYEKIYLCFGVNELGWYGDERFYENYGALIDDVRARCPEADVYLQTLLPVTRAKSQAGTNVTNEGIVAFNETIVRLAAEKQVYLVDPYSVFAGEDGALEAAGSVDGIHLKKDYYAKWLDYLRTHTIPAEEE